MTATDVKEHDKFAYTFTFETSQVTSCRDLETAMGDLVTEFGVANADVFVSVKETCVWMSTTNFPNLVVVFIDRGRSGRFSGFHIGGKYSEMRREDVIEWV